MATKKCKDCEWFEADGGFQDDYGYCRRLKAYTREDLDMDCKDYISQKTCKHDWKKIYDGVLLRRFQCTKCEKLRDEEKSTFDRRYDKTE